MILAIKYKMEGAEGPRGGFLGEILCTLMYWKHSEAKANYAYGFREQAEFYFPKLLYILCPQPKDDTISLNQGIFGYRRTGASTANFFEWKNILFL